MTSSMLFPPTSLLSVARRRMSPLLTSNKVTSEELPPMRKTSAVLRYRKAVKDKLRTCIFVVVVVVVNGKLNYR